MRQHHLLVEATVEVLLADAEASEHRPDRANGSWHVDTPLDHRLQFEEPGVAYRYGFRPRWLRVLRVCPSTQDGWVYLHGYHAEEEFRVERVVFSRVDGMVIRRGA
ncbi:MAG TPA: hypothetical protein VGN37_02690 [Actinocatenispora sp.]